MRERHLAIYHERRRLIAEIDAVVRGRSAVEVSAVISAAIGSRIEVDDALTMPAVLAALTLDETRAVHKAIGARAVETCSLCSEPLEPDVEHDPKRCGELQLAEAEGAAEERPR